MKKNKKTTEGIYFGILGNRLVADVLDTYNFLKSYDDFLASEFLRKSKGAEKQLKKQERVYKMSQGARKEKLKESLVDLDEKPKKKRWWS